MIVLVRGGSYGKDGTAKAFRWKDGALEETARYSQRPWFAGNVHLGRLLARIGPDRRQIDLYRFGETHLG